MSTPGPAAPVPDARCPLAHDDAAYVLGSLSPAERLRFERHLPGCASCSRSVRSFAGLPGLLDLVDPDVLAAPAVDPPVPATVLPALTRAVHARRRRRTLVVAGLAASVAAAVALAVPPVLDRSPATPDPGAAPTPSSPSATPDAGETRTMAPQGEVPVTATVGLEQVTWGTRMLLTCTYDRDAIDVRLPARVPYFLFVTDTAGRTEQVGSWTSVSGTTMTVPAATSVPLRDIADVEVRTIDGLVVLRLSA